MCLAEKDSNYTEMPATYAEFWGGPAHYGYVYYDGALDLATMFEYVMVGSSIHGHVYHLRLVFFNSSRHHCITASSSHS